MDHVVLGFLDFVFLGVGFSVLFQLAKNAPLGFSVIPRLQELDDVGNAVDCFGGVVDLQGFQSHLGVHLHRGA